MILNGTLILILTFSGSLASLLLKRASGADSLVCLFKNKNLYAGAFLYLFSAVLNILLLRRLAYSVVLPLTSLTYIWTLLLARCALKEKISRRQICGILCLLCGAMCVAL